jgi:simple sugar transport system substrate-binding protein
VLTDRAVEVSDDSLYVTFIGSDFVEEGRRAAKWLVEKTGGKAVIAELVGTPGSAPAIDRKTGFEEIIAAHPEMKIIKSQSGDFNRAKGKEVMETFLKSPEGKSINVLYAHNDDMALGAIQAIEEVGLKPGTDIIIVSIDGVRGAFEAMVAGKLNCTVECNPMIGDQLFELIKKVAAGETVPKRVAVEEGVYDQSTAALFCKGNAICWFTSFYITACLKNGWQGQKDRLTGARPTIIVIHYANHVDSIT